MTFFLLWQGKGGYTEDGCRLMTYPELDWAVKRVQKQIKTEVEAHKKALEGARKARRSKV